MKNSLINLAAGLLVMVLPSNAFANDEALYGAPLPSDAVFLRWIGDITEASVKAFSYEFKRSDTAADAYVAISSSALIGATPGAHYSIISSAGAAPIKIEEPERANKSKVHLTLLNATEMPVRLMLAGTDKEVIGATVLGSASSRAVNPVTATLAVVDKGTSTPLEKFNVSLRRGQNLTFVVLENDVLLIEDRFGNVIEAE